MVNPQSINVLPFQRRCKYLEGKNLLYVGSGVSGGEDGARFGPSLMPGGSEAAWYDTWVKVFRIISGFRIEADFPLNESQLLVRVIEWLIVIFSLSIKRKKIIIA